MRTRSWVLLVAVLLVSAACGGPGSTPAAPATGTPPAASDPPASDPAVPPSDDPSGEPTGDPGEPSGDPGTAFDCGPGSGDLTLAGFSAGNVEEGILRGVLDSFEEACPNYTVAFEVIAGEYGPVMLTRLGSGDAPDLFYVQQGYSQDWITQGVLQPLDDRISESGFDLSSFYEGYLAPFQQEGQTFGIPKDSSVLGMQTNDEMLAAAEVEVPTTVEELEAAAVALKESGVETPMCFAAEYARAGALIHAFGGGMLTEDRTAPLIDSPESRAALDWYLQAHTDGLAQNPPQMGVDWCGQALGEERVAIAFEGNWVGPAMSGTYPEVAYTVSAIPADAEQATLSFTAAYAYSPDSPNPDGSWALLSYLTSQEGMQEWTNGGLVLPSRSDVEVEEETLQSYAPFAEFAYAGEGLLPGWSQIQDAFNGALRNAADGNGTTDDIVNATVPAIEAALSQ
ncbi:MAG: extracellular solute-binding protein [Chloroflexi bacterium]|nr:extracellular solute-binding protein [Chloroflexota bacterium]